MVYKLFYTNQAEKDLARMDRLLVVRILKKMDYFAALPEPLSKAGQLKGFDIPTYRFRIGDYRVVFRKDQKNDCLVILVVLRVEHRKEIYKKF